jgi:uncharacterized BrkB/YihY/UPF0761 family membrane protein
LVNRILDTVYARIPVVGAQLREDPKSLEANGAVAAVGLLITIWSGLAVVRVAWDAVNLQWAVPRFRQAGFIRRQLRALCILAVIGLGIIAATAATTLAAFLPDLPVGGRIGVAAIAVVLNVVVLTLSFRVLVAAEVDWRALVPGGLVGGVVLWVLQLVGGEYVSRVIVDASDVFGMFATTFGLLAWIALVSRVVLLAGELNVVRAKRLWPRGLLRDRPTDADRRSYQELMRREALAPVAFEAPDPTDPSEPTDPSHPGDPTEEGDRHLSQRGA